MSNSDEVTSSGPFPAFADASQIGFSLKEDEIELHAIRAGGPGGQHVNKVSTAIHLRFDIQASSLPQIIKSRMTALKDRRINREGIVVIKAQQNRSQEKNRAEAISRLFQLIGSVAIAETQRKATRPSYGAKMKRLESKSTRGKIKIMRGKVTEKFSD